MQENRVVLFIPGQYVYKGYLLWMGVRFEVHVLLYFFQRYHTYIIS